MADQEQGNVRQETNSGQSGLNMDSSIGQVSKGALTYALNAAVENFDANSVNYQNEPGNELCLNFPRNFHNIGNHFIPEQNKHIFFLVNPETGASQIGYMENNDCIYVQYIQGDCLNFNINNPIHKAVHKITNCVTEIYWTDGLNPRRYLNLNNPPWLTTYTDGIICDPVVHEGVIDCNKLNIQPNFSIPELVIADITNVGDLTAGTYQFAIQYASAIGNGYTSYYSVTNPTSIANPQLTTLDFNYAVGRAIIVSIDNLDLTGYFQYYNLAVIKTINGVSSVELVGTYFIDGLSRQITYTGQNLTQIPLSTADIFEKFPYYDIAQDLTAVQDILVWDNLTSIDKLNYQLIANKIDLQWETYKLPNTDSYANALNTVNLRGYLRDEVYAFEITFLLKNGKQTDSFHIPGRAKNSNEAYPDVPSTNPDYIGPGTSAPYWKIYNTASVTGTAIGPSIGNATPYQYGEFAYWESTEKYPCNTLVWGDLADTYIRHHKFPDVLVSPIFQTPTPEYNLDGTYKTTMQNDAIYPIGVRVSTDQIVQLINQSTLTQQEKNNIAGYKITRGDRGTNKSIVAKGILRNVGKYEREKTEYYYPNYPYNDLNKDPFLLKENNGFNAQCGTFKILVYAAGTLQYTDCNTGELTVITVGFYTLTQCSMTIPVMLTGAAVIENVTGISYTLSAFFDGATSWANFQYTIPGGSSATAYVLVNEPQTISSSTVPTYTNGTDKYSITRANNINITCYPHELEGFNEDASKYRQVFNSPETSFGQPILGNILKLESAIYGAGKSHFVQVKKHALYKLISEQAQVEALTSSYNIAFITGTLDSTAMFTAYQAYLQIYINGISRKNFTYSFNSIASYDYSADIANNLGVKQRELDIYQYLIPGVQSVGDLHNVNNFQRESSVYLKTKEAVQPLPFPNQTPSVVVAGKSLISDNSRFTLSQRSNCATPEMQEHINTICYYASLKNTFVNQWGQMYSYSTIDTGFQRIFNSLSVDQPDVVFGGDTFITRFAFKTKLPFFIDNRVGAPDDSDVFYDEIGNVAYPQYWYSARSVLSNYIAGTVTLRNIISIKAHNLDCANDATVLVGTTTTTTTNAGTFVTSSSTTMSYDGKMYLFAYGIPSFYVESSINVDLRQAFNNLEGDFYPHVSTGIPDNWLQQSVVPIQFDNTYHYNVTYSRQNKDNYFSHLPVDWNGNQCYTNFPFRAIYSEAQQNDPSVKVNNWLTYAPISFFDFPQTYGNITSLDGIQNKAILARFENKSLLYNTMLTVQTSNPQAAYLGNDTLFRSSPPIDFADTDLGYMGSQNKMLLKIPNGQITIDAKRGQIFLVAGNQAQEISAFGSGLNRFFTDHLAFEILRYFPNANIDNHFNGCGLHGVYDSKYDRIIISKLDYVPQFDKIDIIKYDDTLQKYYIEHTLGQSVLIEYIDLTNRKYFCNKSWTLSFNFSTRTWISFHSYIPNWYIAENNFFYSGLNEGCDLEAIAVQEIPTPTTTTTTTIVLDCALAGFAVIGPCELDGTAYTNDPVPTTTTTTSSSTSTTTTTSSSTSTTTTTTTATPTTTTTTTVPPPTTTTTTTAQTYYYYSGTQYLNCILNGPTKILRSTSPLTLSWVCGGDGYQYSVGAIDLGPAYDADVISEWTNCADATC